MPPFRALGPESIVGEAFGRIEERILRGLEVDEQRFRRGRFGGGLVWVMKGGT